MADIDPKSNNSSTAIGLLAFILAIAGIIYAQSIIISLLLALFISIIMAEPIYWLQKKKLPQGLAVTIVLLGSLLVFLVFVEIIGSSVASFSKDAPKYEQSLKELGGTVVNFLSSKGINISTDQLSGIIDPSKIMKLTAVVLGDLGGFMGNSLTIFFLVVFLLLELDSFSLKAKAIAKHTNASFEYLRTISDSIRHYLSIKMMTSLITGLVIWLGLAILGLDYAILWALIAFLLNFIPNIGSIIAAIPAVMFAMIQLGFGGAAWTIAIFLTVNMVVGNVVEPKMMGKGLGLSTFVVFFSLIFWGFILGTVGMFLSVPLTMTIKIILSQKPGTRWIAVLLGSDDDIKMIEE